MYPSRLQEEERAREGSAILLRQTEQHMSIWLLELYPIE
jgi:hypothetical protein